MRKRQARDATAAALLAILLLGAGPAAAKTATLAHGAMNLVGAPLDLALSPYTATASFVRKYYLGGDQSALRKVAMTPVVGALYLPSCVIINMATTFMRFVDGMVNVPLGLAVLASDVEPDTTIYEPVHGKPGALVDFHGIYFGAYHCEGYFQ